MYLTFFKRPLDIIVSLFCLVLFLPVLVCIAVVLLFSTGGRPFFLQKRPGKGEKIFTVIKFRTMTGVYDRYGRPRSDAERVTRLGRMLRNSSLDELPQLVNVLFGSMSLVGPRPLLPEYLPLYSDLQRKRHHVRPGITGLAQVSGRNALSWQQKFELDVVYVERVSFFLDLKIMWLSVSQVVSARGVNASPEDTMPNFEGN